MPSQSPFLECPPVSSLLLESQVRTDGVFPGEVLRALARLSLPRGTNDQCHSFGPQGVPLCLIFVSFLARWPPLSRPEAGLTLLRNPGPKVVVPYIDRMQRAFGEPEDDLSFHFLLTNQCAWLVFQKIPRIPSPLSISAADTRLRRLLVPGIPCAGAS